MEFEVLAKASRRQHFRFRWLHPGYSRLRTCGDLPVGPFGVESFFLIFRKIFVAT
jgi:hypothetical protein